MSRSPTRSLVPLSLAAGLVCAGLALVQPAAAAEPRSFAASPEVYKVIAENPSYRVIEVTWKPGQRDQLHSHPASAVYYLTDCALRGHLADGSMREGKPRAGTAVVQAEIAGHWVENIGTSDCRLVMFEPY